MIEENVVSAAGAHNRADEKMLQFLIREAGFIPQQRDILYEHVDRQAGHGGCLALNFVWFTAKRLRRKAQGCFNPGLVSF